LSSKQSTSALPSRQRQRRRCPTASSNWLRLDGKQDAVYREETSAALWSRSGQPAVVLFVNVDQLGLRLSRFTLRDALVCRLSVAVTASL
jgi:hypothetical protein